MKMKRKKEKTHAESATFPSPKTSSSNFTPLARVGSWPSRITSTSSLSFSSFGTASSFPFRCDPNWSCALACSKAGEGPDRSIIPAELEFKVEVEEVLRVRVVR